MKSNRFTNGLKLLFGGTIGFYVIRYLIPYIVTGTSFSENMMTYIVPLAAFLTIIVGVLFVWFKPGARY